MTNILPEYIEATYWVKSQTTLEDAALAIAIGQSVNNPLTHSNVTDELYSRHGALVGHVNGHKAGYVQVLFPTTNLNWEEDGVSHLLCQLQGGQSDIDFITECQLLHLELPKGIKPLQHPGIKVIREATGVYDKPLLGGIIKPKIGMNLSQTLDVVKQMVDGGVDFIKDDEILSNQDVCPLTDRIEAIVKYLSGIGRIVFYLASVTSDPHVVLDRARKAHFEYGATVHVNWWSGLGTYKSIRQLNPGILLFFQRSGIQSLIDKRNPFGIHWRVICKLAAYSGVDIIHAGMWGGYKSDNEDELKDILELLREYNVLPSLSCGMHSGLIGSITQKFGVDYLANVGGAIHSHPMGITAGVKAMRQAIDGDYGKEYYAAVDKWGKK